MTSATTYSMIIAGVIENYLKNEGLSQSDLFERTRITQPTWARLCRGQSKLDVEQLFSIQNAFDYKVSDLIGIADDVIKKANIDGIKIIPPISTQNGKLTKTDGVAIVAVAVLAYMALKATR